jgi:integrase
MEINQWLNGITGKAPATINRLKVTFSSLYRYGKLMGKVDVNPARDVPQKQLNNERERYLSPAEEKRIRAVLQGAVDDCPQHMTLMRNRLQHRIYEFEIALGTGARKSEQYGLCWSDVDLKHKTVTFRDTKNGDTRTIPMIQSVYSAFKQLDKMRLKRKDRREGEPNPASSDAVFGIGDNKKWWKATLKKARVNDFRWHDLRHTFCSRLSQRDTDLKIIKEAAGHKTIQTTDRYSHLNTHTLRRALTVLDQPNY